MLPSPIFHLNYKNIYPGDEITPDNRGYYPLKKDVINIISKMKWVLTPVPNGYVQIWKLSKSQWYDQGVT